MLRRPMHSYLSDGLFLPSFWDLEMFVFVETVTSFLLLRWSTDVSMSGCTGSTICLSGFYWQLQIGLREDKKGDNVSSFGKAAQCARSELK